MSSFSPSIISRGEVYYHKDAVSIDSLKNENGEIDVEATVDGTFQYNVKMSFSPKDLSIIDMSCSCPYGFPCKHEVAVLLTLENRKDKLPINDNNNKFSKYEDKQNKLVECLLAIQKRFSSSLSIRDKDLLDYFFMSQEEYDKAFHFLLGFSGIQKGLKNAVLKYYFPHISQEATTKCLKEVFDYSQGYTDNERDLLFSFALRRDYKSETALEEIYKTQKDDVDKYIKSKTAVPLLKGLTSYNTEDYSDNLFKIVKINPRFFDNSTLMTMLYEYADKEEKEKLISLLRLIPESKVFFSYANFGSVSLKEICDFLSPNEVKEFPLLTYACFNQLYGAKDIKDYLFWRSFVSTEEFEKNREYILDSYKGSSHGLYEGILLCEGDESITSDEISTLSLEDLLAIASRIKDKLKKVLIRPILSKMTEIEALNSLIDSTICKALEFLSDFPTAEVISAIANDHFENLSKDSINIRIAYLKFLIKTKSLGKMGLYLYK